MHVLRPINLKSNRFKLKRFAFLVKKKFSLSINSLGILLEFWSRARRDGRQSVFSDLTERRGSATKVMEVDMYLLHSADSN